MNDPDLLTLIGTFNERWMADFRSRDAKAVGEHYTEDAVSLAPGSRPVRGKQAIVEYWRGAMVSGTGALDIQTTEVERAGERIIEIGETNLLGPEGDLIDRFNYIVIWKKSGDTWLIDREIWNSATE